MTPLPSARSVAETLSVDAYGPLKRLSTLFIDGVGRRIFVGVEFVPVSGVDDVSNATSSHVGHMYSSQLTRQTAHAGLAHARVGLVK